MTVPEEAFIRGLPKAELHLHIEGTLEPEMMFELAARNQVALPYGSVEAIRAAYEFDDLQSFLDIYYRGAAVLRTEQDFYDLMRAYLRRAHEDAVLRSEIFFDPQTHTERGVGFDVFMPGLRAAMRDAKAETGISSGLILCFLRHLPAEAAVATWRQAEPYRNEFIGVGLDSSELGNPPGRFAEVFSLARAAGLRSVAHAGEEGPPEYIVAALDELGAERIDHGVRADEDDVLLDRLVAERIPLTVCPLSNVALGVCDRLEQHPLRRLLHRGALVTINSDDPAYFGGYVADNYVAVAHALDLGRDELVRLARNSLEATFLEEGEKRALVAKLDAYAGR